MGVKVVLVEPGGFRTAIFDEIAAEVERRGDSPYHRSYERMLQALRLEPALPGRPGGGGPAGRVARWAPATRGPGTSSATTPKPPRLAERFTPTFVRDLVTRQVMGLG